MFNQFINASGTIENDIKMNRLVTLTVSLPFTKKNSVLHWGIYIHGNHISRLNRPKGKSEAAVHSNNT